MSENKTAKTSADGGTGFNYARALGITVLRQALETKQKTAVKPAKQWVGLTDEEIYEYADKYLYQHGSNYGIKAFGKAIEAKLKEKNNG